MTVLPALNLMMVFRYQHGVCDGWPDTLALLGSIKNIQERHTAGTHVDGQLCMIPPLRKDFTFLMWKMVTERRTNTYTFEKEENLDLMSEIRVKHGTG